MIMANPSPFVSVVLGRCGLAHEATLVDFPDMSGFEVRVSGSVKMVEAAVPAFIEHGLRSLNPRIRDLWRKAAPVVDNVLTTAYSFLPCQ